MENGSENGYGDSEEYYENGDNGVKPKIVYGDYGVPIAYVADETPEEEKAYSTYSDLVIAPKEGFHYRAKEIPDEWELAFDVKNVKFEVPKVKNAQSKEGEVIIQAYSSYFKSRLKKMRRIFRENPEIGTIVDIAKLSYVREDDVTIIGLVNEKRETRKGYLFEIEDATGRIKVFIGSDKEGANEAYSTIMPDSVVAFRGTPGREYSSQTGCSSRTFRSSRGQNHRLRRRSTPSCSATSTSVATSSARKLLSSSLSGSTARLTAEPRKSW